MTITNTDRVIVAAGNGATTVWPYAFNIPDAASANVELTETSTGIVTVVAAADYTITGLATGSGTVTYPKTGTPLASTYTIAIYRDVPATQTTNITNQTKYDASVVMAVWDRIVMMVQDLTETIGRQLVFPLGETTDATLPTVAERASKFLGFNASGEPIASTTITTSVVSSFMETVLDDTTTSEAQTTLGVLVGTDVQAWDAELETLAGASAANATAVTNLTGVNSGDEVAATTSVEGLVKKSTSAINIAGTDDTVYPSVAGAKEIVDTFAPPPLTQSTKQSTTSGTVIDFPSIPAGTKEVIVSFQGVSLTGGNDILVQLGDSGGLETTGYISSSEGKSSTVGMIISVSDNLKAVTGNMRFVLMDAATNLWVSDHSVGVSTAAKAGGGSKALSGVLTQLRITPTGANAFDAGQVNILYV